MSSQSIATSSGKMLHIHDDLFTYDEKTSWFGFILKSVYKIDGGDEAVNYKKTYQMYSQYSQEDVDVMGFRNSVGYKFLDTKYDLSQRAVKQTRINLSYSGEACGIHADRPGLTLVYYANNVWDINWGGHTLFMDDNLNEPEYTCLFKPGRVAIFDGSIPHMIMTPVAPCHRFTFAMQFE